MQEVKTRFILKRPQFLWLDYEIDLAIAVLLAPGFFFLPKYAPFYLLAFILLHALLAWLLREKPEKYLQNTVRFYMVEKGIWLKEKDTAINRRLKND